MKTLAKLLVCIFLIVISGIVFFSTGFIHRRLNDRVKYLEETCTETADGEVYTKPRSGTMFFKNNVVGASFILDGKTYHAGGIDDSKHDPGDIVTVHFNPDRPDECYAGIRPGMYNLKVIMLIYGVSILIIVCSIVMIIRYTGKLKEESEVSR
ncbi:MAG: hypothetical protein IKW90_07565 [Lachnospiraceae bacterium]|nr:hypothetical protein [Lachnospiraceae bacterium]